jgi:hypothetical protein
MLTPISEINAVHTVTLDRKIYDKVASYLREERRKRCYREYLGSVYELDDDNRTVTFQSERLPPADDRGRPRVLLLISNAHPKSIKSGMFHMAESGVADLWLDLRATGLFSADDETLGGAESLRRHCLSVKYEGPFCLGFACYWLFPTYRPAEIPSLFGTAWEPGGLGDPKERFGRMIAEWKPIGVVSFNGEVFERITGLSSEGYVERLKDKLVQGQHQADGSTWKVFQTYPAAWRFDSKATDLRRSSMRRIREALEKK